jgi:hypothetical protein
VKGVRVKVRAKIRVRFRVKARVRVRVAPLREVSVMEVSGPVPA